MSKIAFVFPGQGAQYVGMAKAFVDQYPCAKTVFAKASTALGYDMEAMCFEASEDTLKKTENTQPAILTASIAMYEVLKSKGIEAQGFAGLSLGEYSALVATGTLAFEEAVTVVRNRGRYMQEAVPEGVGTMAAILGLEKTLVEAACQEACHVGVVEAVNYNCPGQLVIAGEVAAVEKAVELAREKGAKKAVVLPVSAPFHTSLLKGAGQRLALKLDEISYKEMSMPVYANVTGQLIKSHDVVKETLVAQVSSPVLWEDSIVNMIQEGYDTFIEVGPGKALSKFIKKISRQVTILNVEDHESLEKTLVKLKEAGHES